MDTLTHIEKQKLERELGMSGGYVLGFSTRTFQEFFREVVGIDIYDAKFDCESGSKANRIRAFWGAATQKELILFLDGLMDAWELYADAPIPESASELLGSIRGRISATSDNSCPADSTPTRFADIHFDVALSFPGTKRPYVSEIANRLKGSLGENKVFYDKFYQAHLAKPDLDTLLQSIYRNRSSLVVVFLASDYAQSDWCGLEWRAVRDIIKSKNTDQLMFVRFDDAAIDGTFGIDGYIDAAAYSAEQTAHFVLERIADATPSVAQPAPETDATPEASPFNAAKRERDIEAMRWALQGIHLPTLDDMIDGLPRYINDRAMHFWESFNGVVMNSLFHIYDEEVSELITAIHKSWGDCFNASYYHQAANPSLYVFANPGDMPLDSDQQQAWDRIQSARSNLRNSLDDLLREIREKYLEIDLRSTNSAAWTEYVEFTSEFGSAPPSAISKSDQTPIYFGDDWESFSTDAEGDILFRLPLSAKVDLLDYIVIQKALKPEVFTSRVKGLLAAPEMSPDPYQGGTALSMLVFSDPSGKQTSENCEWFFDRYAPIFPDDISVDVCDGNSQAMWLWNCSVPEHWLIRSRPFVKDEFRPDLTRLLDGWISAHNRAIASIPPIQEAEQSSGHEPPAQGDSIVEPKPNPAPADAADFDEIDYEILQRAYEHYPNPYTKAEFEALISAPPVEVGYSLRKLQKRDYLYRPLTKRLWHEGQPNPKGYLLKDKGIALIKQATQNRVPGSN